MADAKQPTSTERTISTVDFEDSVNVDINETRAGPSKVIAIQDEVKYEVVSPNIVEVEGKVCPVELVTVFLDRAEVSRAVETPVSAGENEILITGLPRVMDEDSIRVQCFGEATIIEVSLLEKVIKHEIKNEDSGETSKNEEALLTNEKLELEKKKTQIKEQRQVLEKEKEFLLNYGERLRPTDKGVDKLSEAFDKKSLDSVASFLEFFHSNCEKLNSKIFALKEECKRITEDISVIENRLLKLAPAPRVDSSSLDKRVSVLLEVPSETRLKLVLSYVVSNASWTPLYDLRAFSKESRIELLYFGTIQQLTGEDWVDAKLSLSTAMPSVGGSPPELDSWNIQEERSYARKTERPNLRRGFSLAREKRSRKAYAANYAYDDVVDESMSFQCSLMEAPPQASSRPYFESEVMEGVTSTCFEIARNSTIKSDNTGHKVSICQIKLSPKFEYSSVPKLVAHAFLKASVKNTSNYALLAGPVNVFLDNNFLTKSHLDAVSPLEEFDVSLGVDAAVKVTYKPLKKYKQRTGLVSKHINTQFHQEIVVKNTKASAVRITITDSLPKSADDRIKVTLVEPAIPNAKQKPKGEESDKAVKLNDKNQVEWVLDIAASATKELNFKYSIEHPANIRVSGI